MTSSAVGPGSELARVVIDEDKILEASMEDEDTAGGTASFDALDGR